MKRWNQLYRSQDGKSTPLPQRVYSTRGRNELKKRTFFDLVRTFVGMGGWVVIDDIYI